MAAGGSGASGPARLDDLPLETVERVLIQKALSRYEGNVSHAAQALGLSRSALYRRLEKHGL
jgi:transcriptional regulator of acetoin/glycerol metabolism